MLSKILKTIKKNSMILPGECILVGLSGGADSMCLTHVLSSLQLELSFSLYTYHVHHHLRGAEADRDANCAKDFAAELGLPFSMGDADVYGQAKKNGESLETAARNERYRLLFQEAKRLGCTKIALAHHQDDQVETVIFRLLRGSGADGLAGMSYIRKDGVIRPLLDVSRREIEEYCLKFFINYCTDSSNLEEFCSRNSIRISLLPMLEEKYNPAIKKVIARTSEQFRAENDFWEEYLNSFFDSICIQKDKEIIIKDLAGFNGLHIAIRRRLLRYILLKLNSGLPIFSHIHLERLIEFMCCGKPGKALSWPGNILIKHHYDTVSLSKLNKTHEKISLDGFQYELSLSGVATYIPEAGIEISVNKIDANNKFRYYEKAVYADIYLKNIQLPLIVRSRKPGDRFRPIGLNGTRKLQDYFVDKKVPKAKRDKIPLLTDAIGVLWIIGNQMDERCRISADNDEEILRILVAPAEGYSEE